MRLFSQKAGFLTDGDLEIGFLGRTGRGTFLLIVECERRGKLAGELTKTLTTLRRGKKILSSKTLTSVTAKLMRFEIEIEVKKKGYRKLTSREIVQSFVDLISPPVETSQKTA